MKRSVCLCACRDSSRHYSTRGNTLHIHCHPPRAWDFVSLHSPRGRRLYVWNFYITLKKHTDSPEENRTLQQLASARGSTLLPARTQNGTLGLLGGKLVVALALSESGSSGAPSHLDSQITNARCGWDAELHTARTLTVATYHYSRLFFSYPGENANQALTLHSHYRYLSTLAPGSR